MKKELSDQEKIGQFIAALREEKGLSQSELARLLETSQSAVARMESGEQNFSTEMLTKISSALNRDIISLNDGSLNFKIQGGHELRGKIETNTSKNSAVFLLCASLLNKGKTTLRSMPRIEEVNRLIEVLKSIGFHIQWKENNDLEIDPPKKFDLSNLDQIAATKTRSIVMFIGPLLGHLSSFSLPHPGGCKLGRRSVLPHIYALADLGAKIEVVRGRYDISRKKMKAGEIVMYEAGDTVTGNALMAAALIPGKTTIKFASANYQVQDLCRFLEVLGVRISGIGTTTLVVEGVEEINKDIEFYPSEDPIESMLFIAIAASTKSSLTILRCPIDFLELELLKLEKMGFRYKILKKYKSRNGYTNLVDIETKSSSLRAPEDKIHASPYPGLNIDNLPFFVPIATQAKGTTLIHDWVYENRAIYYLELNKLGANIILADPHRVYVEGQTDLRGAEVICPPALRPAVIVLIAMLAAKGHSVLRNVYSINRGYEDLVNRLKKLGAKIELLHGI